MVTWLVLSACSSSPQNYKGIYEKQVQNAKTLDVPPDLDAPQENRQSDLPQELTQSYSTFTKSHKEAPTTGTQVVPEYKNMRFVRDGALFWVEAKEKPETLWIPLRDFFQKLGFKTPVEQPQLGIMETDWRDNRAGLPTGWFASLFNKVLSNGIKDRYRIRLERGATPDTTLIFIAHQRFEEVGEGGAAANVNTEGPLHWELRPAIPELEVEMLTRFMAYRGVEESVAQQQVAAAPVVQRTQMEEKEGQPVLVINDSFARSWRLAEIALDRLGFLIEDRNRSSGLYYIKLPENYQLEGEKGWLSGLFAGKASKPSTDKFLLVLEDYGEKTRVSLRSREGKADDLATVAKKILGQLQQNMM